MKSLLELPWNIFARYAWAHYFAEKRQAWMQLIILPALVPVALLCFSIAIAFITTERSQIPNQATDVTPQFVASVGVVLINDTAEYRSAITTGVVTKLGQPPTFYENKQALANALSDKTHHAGLVFTSLRPIHTEFLLDNRHYDAVKPLADKIKAGFDDLLLPLRQSLAGVGEAGSDAFAIATFKTEKLGPSSSLYLPLVLAGLIFFGLIYAQDIVKTAIFKLLTQDNQSDDINHFLSLGYSPIAMLLTRVGIAISLLILTVTAILTVLMSYAYLYYALLQSTVGEVLKANPQISDATTGYEMFINQLGLLDIGLLWVVMMVGGALLLMINILILLMVKREETAVTISNMLNLFTYLAPMMALMLGSNTPDGVYALPIFNVFFAIKSTLFGTEFGVMSIYLVSAFLVIAAAVGLAQWRFVKTIVHS